MAVIGNQVGMGKCIIFLGAELNSVNNNGESALHIATRCKSYQMLQILLQTRANRCLQTKYGETLLYYAAQYGDVRVLKTLHGTHIHGLNVQAQSRGLTASQIARRRTGVAPEWALAFEKLLRDIEFPDQTVSQPRATAIEMDVYHDAVEHGSHRTPETGI
ncbi:hypothetical protein MMC14_009454 [Varicellaria rhodocarpa]|nr:hypothetical protein [Varicellaria rhodocarpa]